MSDPDMSRELDGIFAIARELDVDRLARAIDRVDKGIETRYPGATETSRQHAAKLAAAYSALAAADPETDG